MDQIEWHEKVEKYFKLLHPNFDSMAPEEKWNVLDDKTFIINNIDAVHQAFSDFSNSDSPRYMKNASEQERIQQAMWHTKVQKYFKLLHPDFDSMTPEEKWNVLDDKTFIINNIDVVHQAFSDFSNSDSPRYMESVSEQERLQQAINEIKTKEKNSKEITPTEAARSAIKGTTTDKADEANGIEHSELTSEYINEGETKDD